MEKVLVLLMTLIFRAETQLFAEAEEAVLLLQMKATQSKDSPSSLGFCDVKPSKNSSSDITECRKISNAEGCAEKTACDWSFGNPFPGFCGIRDDPSWERKCIKLTRPSECLPSSCKWFRLVMAPGPVVILPH